MPELAMIFEIWSNVAYVAAALFCLNYILKSERAHKLSLFFTTLIIFVGAGSSLFHIYRTPLAQLSDVIPCWTFMLTYIGAALYYMLEVSKLRTFLYMVLFMASLAVTGTYHLEAPSMPWIPGGIMLWVLSIGLYHRGKHSYYSIGLGALCFTIGLSLKAANPLIIEYLTIGTHWIWHLITALMFVYLVTGMHDCFLAAEKRAKEADGPLDVLGVAS